MWINNTYTPAETIKELQKKTDALFDFYKIANGGKLETIGKVNVTEAVLDDLRNFFGTSIHFADVPVRDFAYEHICWGQNVDIPTPDLKIGDEWGECAYRYDFLMFRCYIFLSSFANYHPAIYLAPPSYDKSTSSWVPIFSHVYATRDPVVLAEALADYGLDGADALYPANVDDVNVAIWVKYHFDDDFDDAQKSGFFSSYCFSESFVPTYFSTYFEAKKLIDEQFKRSFTLRPYEISRPTYTIVNTTRDAAYL